MLRLKRLKMVINIIKNNSYLVLLLVLFLYNKLFSQSLSESKCNLIKVDQSFVEKFEPKESDSLDYFCEFSAFIESKNSLDIVFTKVEGDEPSKNIFKRWSFNEEKGEIYCKFNENVKRNLKIDNNVKNEINYLTAKIPSGYFFQRCSYSSRIISCSLFIKIKGKLIFRYESMSENFESLNSKEKTKLSMVISLMKLLESKYPITR